MRIVFMGTPDFAAHCLQKLLDAGHEVTAVYTQPDRPRGRGREVQMSAVKTLALRYGLPVFQPEKIRAREAVEELKGLTADIFVVAAFGQILSQEILDMPEYGCINVHASLLPRYRGAAPIQWAVINGDEYSGVTIQQMNAGVDTGDILYTRKYRLKEDETGDSLFDALTELGGQALVEALELLEKGELTPVPQEEEKATYAGKLNKEMGHLDFSKPAPELERLVRGLNSWPGAYAFLGDKQLKIWKAQALPDVPEMPDASFGETHARWEQAGDTPKMPDTSSQGTHMLREGAGDTPDTPETSGTDMEAAPGTIIARDSESFTVACGSGAFRLLEVQPAGKKRMSVRDFLLGYGKMVQMGGRLE
ncbi:MAG: methionyl-tRNA formyltransferase [Lachnospiraceae bacterium]|nr:methionyl-tRNA formyltransferase [Lachnospiraceae bacterium]